MVYYHTHGAVHFSIIIREVLPVINRKTHHWIMLRQ